MKVSRRDLLVWSAGAAAGLMVTPVPWKLLDDTSIWSQNWPWIPQPKRVPVEIKQSCCTLCPNGCGLKVRIAAGWPVGVAGLSTHPVSRGSLCPLAFGAHQLNWHPRRLKSVSHHGSVSSWEEARAAFAKACGEGPVLIVDGYPGRAASSVLESFVQARNGGYEAVYPPETRALTPYEMWSGVRASSLGYDLENSRTIVSFGAPMLDGWGTPGRFTRLWADRAAGVAEPQLRLIQVESTLSRTGARAWRWIPVHAESYAALAAGIARVLLEEQLVPTRGPMPAISLAEVSVQTGLSTDAIRDLARAIVENRPSVAIGGTDPSIAALNVVLGAVGARGGIVRRTSVQPQTRTTNVPARAVLIDSSVPWDFVPQTEAEVFRFAAWDGGLPKQDWLLPAPGFLEELTDVPAAPSSALDTYAVAPNLVKAPPGVQSAAQFLISIDPSAATSEKIIHTRCEELFRQRKGNLIGRESTPVAKLASVQKLEEQLRNGAVWVDEPSDREFRCELHEWPASVISEHSDWSTQWPEPVLPSLATKLYKESGLLEWPERRNA